MHGAPDSKARPLGGVHVEGSEHVPQPPGIQGSLGQGRSGRPPPPPPGGGGAAFPKLLLAGGKAVGRLPDSRAKY